MKTRVYIDNKGMYAQYYDEDSGKWATEAFLPEQYYEIGDAVAMIDLPTDIWQYIQYWKETHNATSEIVFDEDYVPKKVREELRKEAEKKAKEEAKKKADNEGCKEATN